jgi:hypothetical protein
MKLTSLIDSYKEIISQGKLNNIYGKSIDYAALRHRDIIIAKIDLFIQRITHNLWHARKKMCF